MKKHWGNINGQAYCFVEDEGGLRMKRFAAIFGLVLVFGILVGTSYAENCSTVEVAKLRVYFEIQAHEATDCELKAIYENNDLIFDYFIERYENGKNVNEFLGDPLLDYADILGKVHIKKEEFSMFI